jgi:hypothetical protein
MLDLHGKLQIQNEVVFQKKHLVENIKNEDESLFGKKTYSQRILKTMTMISFFYTKGINGFVFNCLGKSSQYLINFVITNQKGYQYAMFLVINKSTQEVIKTIPLQMEHLMEGVQKMPTATEKELILKNCVLKDLNQQRQNAIALQKSSFVKYDIQKPRLNLRFTPLEQMANRQILLNKNTIPKFIVNKNTTTLPFSENNYINSQLEKEKYSLPTHVFIDDIQPNYFEKQVIKTLSTLQRNEKASGHLLKELDLYAQKGNVHPYIVVEVEGSMYAQYFPISSSSNKLNY